MPVHQIKNKGELEARLDAAGGKLVVIDFFATWCGPCMDIAPFIAQFSEDFEEEVVFLKVDVDESEDLSEEYHVTAMPTFVFIKDKEKVDEFVGGDAEKVKELIEKLK